MENTEQLDGFRRDVRGWVRGSSSQLGVDLAGIAGGESGATASDEIKAGMGNLAPTSGGKRLGPRPGRWSLVVAV